MDSIAKKFSLAGEFATKIAENRSMLSECIRDLTDLVRRYYEYSYRQEPRFIRLRLEDSLTISATLSTYIKTKVESELFFVCDVELLDSDYEYNIRAEDKMHLGYFFGYCRNSMEGVRIVEDLSPEQKQSYDILYGYYTEFLEAFGS